MIWQSVRISGSSAGLSGPVLFFVAALLLAASPVIRGGNRYIALAALETGAIVLLLAMLAQAWWRTRVLDAAGEVGPTGNLPRLKARVWWLAASPLLLGLLQLTPLPPGLWWALPGHAGYADLLAAVQMPRDLWRPLSLMPDATWLSLLAALPLVAFFLLGQLASRSLLEGLVRVVALSAVAQAVFGLLQVAQFRDLYYGAQAYGRAIGTYANPNHFASYLGMALPLTLLLLRQALRGDEGDGRRPAASAAGRKRRSRRERLGQIPARQALSVALWSIVLFFQLAGLVASGSRAGLAVAALAGLGAALLVPLKRLSPRAWVWRVVGGGAILLVAILSVGAGGLLSRLGSTVGGDARWPIYQATWQAALNFFPLGSGMGTYAGVFPQFQPDTLAHYVDYAHNDYLQWLVEGGLPLVALAVLAAVSFGDAVRRVFRRLRHNPADPLAALQASAGLGLLAVLLHSLVDFNFRIPANAILACFWAGILLRPRRSRASANSGYSSSGLSDSRLQ